MTARTLTYYIATTLDQFIAHEDGGVDGFLATGHHISDYLDSLRAYDTVLMGRRTYEKGYEYGVQPGQPSPTYAHMQQIVFSSQMADSAHPQLHVIREEAASFTRRLKAQPGGAIYLCGGGVLAGALMSAGLIDEVIVKINPVVFGRGLPLFSGFDQTTLLTMLDTKVYANGVLFVRYRVGTGEAR